MCYQQICVINTYEFSLSTATTQGNITWGHAISKKYNLFWGLKNMQTKWKLVDHRKNHGYKKGSVEDEGEKTDRWKFTIKPGHLTTDSILPYGGRRNYYYYYYYYYFVLFCFDFKFFSFVERDYKTIATFLIQSNLSEKSEDLLFITSIVIAQFRETYPYLQPCKSESVFFFVKISRYKYMLFIG